MYKFNPNFLFLLILLLKYIYLYITDDKIIYKEFLRSPTGAEKRKANFRNVLIS